MSLNFKNIFPEELCICGTLSLTWHSYSHICIYRVVSAAIGNLTCASAVLSAQLTASSHRVSVNPGWGRICISIQCPAHNTGRRAALMHTRSHKPPGSPHFISFCLCHTDFVHHLPDVKRQIASLWQMRQKGWRRWFDRPCRPASAEEQSETRENLIPWV